MYGALAVGVLGLAAWLFFALTSADGSTRAWFSYLHSFCYFLSLSLGALFFVAIQHVVRATWSVVVRRIAEIIAAILPLLFILALPILIFGTSALYEWTKEAAVSADALLTHKKVYLNLPFFWVRIVVYFTIWSILSLYFLKRSTDQDKSGDPQLTVRMMTTSAPAIAILALTLSFASIDLIMSLDAHWFSTIFGVYFFAGSFVGFLALLAVLVIILQNMGHLRKAITAEHYHDMGKLIFAFTMFWCYIAFCQYMLIWYSNIPEETGWYMRRQTGNWMYFSVALLFGHFFIPFAGLMQRWVKRTRVLLAFWAVWILAMHWFDQFYLIMPQFSHETVPFNPALDISALLGVGGIYIAGAAYLARGRSLIPLKDPRLADSLRFENLNV